LLRLLLAPSLVGAMMNDVRCETEPMRSQSVVCDKQIWRQQRADVQWWVHEA